MVVAIMLTIILLYVELSSLFLLLEVMLMTMMNIT